MKKYKPYLCIAAFVFLICVFAPHVATAQDDGPVEWPCRALSGYGLTSPWPCALPTRDDGLDSRPYQILTQNSGPSSSPYNASPKDDGTVSRLHNIFASITPLMGDEILHQHALFEDRREEFALIRS